MDTSKAIEVLTKAQMTEIRMRDQFPGLVKDSDYLSALGCAINALRNGQSGTADPDAKANADFNAGLEQGYKDAWGVAHTLYREATEAELLDKFGTSDVQDIIDGYKAEHIIRGLNEIREAHRFRVGDRVKYGNGIEGVVLIPNYTQNKLVVLSSLTPLCPQVIKKESVSKTGRTEAYVARFIERLIRALREMTPEEIREIT